MSKYKIIRNSAKCAKCGDEIESKYHHDFKFCKCHSIAVDGGKNYIKRCGELEDIIDTSIYKEIIHEDTN